MQNFLYFYCNLFAGGTANTIFQIIKKQMSNFFLTKPINVPLGQSTEGVYLIERLAKLLGTTSSHVLFATLHKQSVDARDKSDVHFVCSYVVQSDNKYLKNATPYTPPQDVLLSAVPCAKGHCIVVGAGPAGLFLSRYLTACGVKVTVVERGSDIVTRSKKVQDFFNGGALDENCNVQFGLGGAGAFSDGKLTTGISSPLVHTVFAELVRAGAPKQILTDAMPHVGTDRLVSVVDAMRLNIQRDGGQFLFDTTVTDVVIENGKAVGVEVCQNGAQVTRKIFADCVALCVGHSARQMFHTLVKHGVDVQFKPFAVGLRVEHPRKFIDKAQYGQLFATHRDLGAATYKLVNNVDGRACYSFCMCPGGVVVPATSQGSAVVVNGMSNFARNEQNSNSALVVSVGREDVVHYGFSDPVFGGVDFQQYLEKRAYEMGGGNFVAPCQNVADFLSDKPSTAFDTRPSYCRGTRMADLRDLLPHDITSVLQRSIEYFNSKIKGFSTCGVLTGVETRTSSPVKIMRNPQTFESNVAALYPVGEGAGHAGGIVSSAVDGLKVGQAIVCALAEK